MKAQLKKIHQLFDKIENGTFDNRAEAMFEIKKMKNETINIFAKCKLGQYIDEFKQCIELLINANEKAKQLN